LSQEPSRPYLRYRNILQTHVVDVIDSPSMTSFDQVVAKGLDLASGAWGGSRQVVNSKESETQEGGGGAPPSPKGLLEEKEGGEGKMVPPSESGLRSGARVDDSESASKRLESNGESALDTGSVLGKKSPNIVFAKEGDMVSAMAVQEYGVSNKTIWDIIKRANPDIQDLDRIVVGQKIILPALDMDSIILKDENGAFSIHIATFRSYGSAADYASRFLGEQYPMAISPVRIVGEKMWYRVSVGSVPSRREAIELAARIVELNQLPIDASTRQLTKDVRLPSVSNQVQQD
jgi:phage tail protein X